VTTAFNTKCGSVAPAVAVTGLASRKVVDPLSNGNDDDDNDDADKEAEDNSLLILIGASVGGFLGLVVITVVLKRHREEHGHLPCERRGVGKSESKYSPPPRPLDTHHRHPFLRAHALPCPPPQASPRRGRGTSL